MSFSTLTLPGGYGSFCRQELTSPGFAFPGPSKVPTIKGTPYVMTEMLYYACPEKHSSLQTNRTEPSPVSDSLSLSPLLKAPSLAGPLA